MLQLKGPTLLIGLRGGVTFARVHRLQQENHTICRIHTAYFVASFEACDQSDSDYDAKQRHRYADLPPLFSRGQTAKAIQRCWLQTPCDLPGTANREQQYRTQNNGRCAFGGAHGAGCAER